MKTVGMIGYGAVGGYVAARIGAESGLRLSTLIVRRGREKSFKTTLGSSVDVLTTLDDVTNAPDVMIDCAGHDGLRQHGASTLALGIDLITVSVGALADQELLKVLTDTATQSNSKLHLASGAIGALDALSAASVGGLDRVVYRGRKPPSGWVGSAAEDVLDLSALTQATVHFNGTARKAALAYPKNANVAASVALAGLGFDQTQVKLIADPCVTENIHEIDAEGAFGSFRFQIKGNALPDNPKSSALTAMSVVRKVLNLQASVVQ